MEFAAATRAVADAVGHVHAVIGHSLGAGAASIAIAGGVAARRAVYLSPVCWMLSLPEHFADVLRIPEAPREALYRKLFETHPRLSWLELSGDVVAAQLETPGLIFHDVDDAEVHHHNGVQIHRAWRDSKLILTEGLGHRRIVHDAAVVARAVDFIAGYEKGDA